MADDVRRGDGWAVANLDDLGTGPGFRKVRQELGVQELGVNALVLPPGFGSEWHWHERQEEVYFVHRGSLELEFGDGAKHVLGPGGLARVAAATRRRLMNVGDEDVTVYVVGAQGGYVGRDGQADPDAPRVRTLGG